MATVQENRPPVKPVHGTCGLTVHINGTDYRARPVPCDPKYTAVKAYRLTKQAGEGDVYDVALTEWGNVECTCPDFEFRRAGIDPAGCKHCKCLVVLGLLTPPPQRTIPADMAELDRLEGGAR